MTALFDANESAAILKWAREQAGPVSLRYALAGHGQDEAFRGYIQALSQLAPCIDTRTDDDVLVALPTLFVDSRVAYQTLPRDRELALFLSVLGDRDAASDRIGASLRQRLNQLDLPALIKVYITALCPYCPQVVSGLLGLAAVSPMVRLTVIDGQMFAEAAEKERVSAAPTIILDDQFRWSGRLDLDELVTLMLDRDPARLGAEALRSMIEEGDAQGVARMMLEQGQLFDSFFSLLGHARWSVRLGAMVAFETVAEESPELATGVVAPLTKMFDHVDDPVKGDLLYVLGESRCAAAAPFLKAVAAGQGDGEVRAAAEEALEKIP